MNIKPIRKLPELKENQEWACEGGCNVVRPKKFENVFSESFANDGSSINRQSEFYFTCQNNHLLKVWCTDKSDSVLLPEEFYQEEASKVVQSNSIEESINLLSDDIDSIKDAFIEESFLTNDDAETLELLITRAIQLGELFATRDAKPQAVPEGFVLVNAESLALHAQSIRMFNNGEEEDDYYEIENHVCAIEAMIEAQEQK